uniref:Uncharacterized protein n=1 Tax=Arundo donax TaxID=35708 RepID=A0A0A9AKZ1_ARUDO
MHSSTGNHENAQSNATFLLTS